MKRFFKYPKLSLLLVLSILTYVLFSHVYVKDFVTGLNHLSYLGIFVAGVFFSFGFSTPFSVGFFLTALPENIYLATLVGGLGALFADLAIFRVARFSFMDEFRNLEHSHIVRAIERPLSFKSMVKVKLYFLYLLGAFIIASPLPDELGVSILAGLTSINVRTLAVISFVMNSFGIFLMLLLGRVIV